MRILTTVDRKEDIKVTYEVTEIGYNEKPEGTDGREAGLYFMCDGGFYLIPGVEKQTCNMISCEAAVHGFCDVSAYGEVETYHEK